MPRRAFLPSAAFTAPPRRTLPNVLGIRQASLYYYFSSKEAALELVCLKGVEGFFEAAKAIATGQGTARKRLSLLIKSHLSPLLDRGDFVKVFLNERQHLPAESRRRIGRWSRGLERIFEDVIKEGIAKGEFRADLDARMAALAIFGMCNAASSWYRKENAPVAAHRCRIHPVGDRRSGQAPHRAPEPALNRTSCYRPVEFRIRLSYRILPEETRVTSAQ